MEKMLLSILSIAGVLLGLLWAWMYWRSTRRLRQSILIIAGWHLLYFLIYFIFLFISYRQSEFSKYLLPPQGDYYLKMIAQEFSGLLAGWVSSLLFFVLLWWFFIRIKKSVYLDITDVFLLTIGAAAVGWPAVLIFFAIVFVMSVVGMIVLVFSRRKTLSDRLFITPFIIPAAIITLFFRLPLLEFTNLIKIRF